MQETGDKKKSAISRKRAALLKNIVHILNPENVLEIGTGFGETLKIILDASVSRRLKILTVDWHWERLEKTKRRIKSKRVSYVYSDAFIFLENLIYEKKENFFDFMLIDSQKKDYINLLHYARRLLKKDGVAFLDDAFYYDYRDKGVILKENYDSFKKKVKGFNVCLIPEETGVLICRKI